MHGLKPQLILENNSAIYSDDLVGINFTIICLLLTKTRNPNLVRVCPSTPYDLNISHQSDNNINYLAHLKHVQISGEKHWQKTLPVNRLAVLYTTR